MIKIRKEEWGRGDDALSDDAPELRLKSRGVLQARGVLDLDGEKYQAARIQIQIISYIHPPHFPSALPPTTSPHPSNIPIVHQRPGLAGQGACERRAAATNSHYNYIQTSSTCSFILQAKSSSPCWPSRTRCQKGKDDEKERSWECWRIGNIERIDREGKKEAEWECWGSVRKDPTCQAQLSEANQSGLLL